MLTSNGVDGKTEILQDTVNGHNRTVLFVNSTAYPNEHIPLKSYKYYEDSEGLTFFRLYRDVWVIDVGDGDSVHYNLYVWYQVSVKSHCRQALRNMIDAFNAAEEFLIQ
jgi:hypothetical protein